MTDILSGSWVSAMGWTLIHSLWQASVIAFVLFLILRSLPDRKARLRYAVSSIALMTVLGSTVATFFLLYNSGGTQMAASPVVVNTTAETTTIGLLPWILIQIKVFLGNYLPLFVFVWLLGVALFSMRMLAGFGYLRYLRQSAEPVSNATIRLGARTAARLGLDRAIRIAQSGAVRIPVVIGYFKPLVLFPIGAVNALTVEETEAVIAHEMAHVLRADYMHNLIQSVVETLFFYHPAVWFISAFVRSEREKCCDDLAVQVCGSSITYARALVKLEDMAFRTPALALPLSTHQSQLMTRIKRVLNQPQNKVNIMEKCIVTSLLLLAVLLFSISATTPDQPVENGDTATASILTVDVYPDLQLRDARAFEGDTVPREIVKIHVRTDDEDILIEFRDGEVRSLSVDGREVPASEYGAYADLIDDLRKEAEKPLPEPPPAPEAPMPPPPPDEFVAPPAPPGVPDPPLPPRVEIRQSRKITTQKDKEGNTVIRIEQEGLGDEEMEILIRDGEHSMIINGESIEGDTVIIIDEKSLPFHPLHFRQGDHKIFKWKGSNMAFPDSLFRFEFKDWDAFDNAENWKRQIEKYEESIGNWVRAFEKHESLNEDQRKELEKQLHLDARELEEKARELERRQRKTARERQNRSQEEEQAVDALLEQLREREEAIRERLESWIHEREPGEHNRVYRIEKPFGRSGLRKSPNQAIIDALDRDGLIDKDGDYAITLTGKKLKVNGKKLSDEQYAQYRSLFERHQGEPLGQKSKIEISRKSH